MGRIIGPLTVIGLLMPVLLGLTIKAHKKKKTHILIPNRPFYHNDEYLDDDESEQQIEMQSHNYDNDIFAIDPQIFFLENFYNDEVHDISKNVIEYEDYIFKIDPKIFV